MTSYSFTISQRYQSNVLVQYGTGCSNKDGAQTFPFKESFPKRPYSAIVCVNAKSVKSSLNISDLSESTFTIDRDNYVDGEIHFFWIAVGDNGQDPFGGIDINGKGIRWGGNNFGNLYTDIVGQAPFYPNFATGDNIAVLAVSASRSTRTGVCVDEVGNTGARVSNNNHLESFNYLAFGESSKDSGPNKITTEDGTILQWGKTTSTKDGSQCFGFDSGFKHSCRAVFTTVQKSAFTPLDYILNVTTTSKTGFTIDRDNAIDGDIDFFWVAIGK